VTAGLAPTYAALLAGVHLSTESSLGGFALEMILKEYDSRREKLNQGDLSDREEERLAKELANLVLLLSHLYNLGVVHCGLIYDLVRELLKGGSSRDMELLLLLLRSSGMQLRGDDPSALKEIVLLAQVRKQDFD